MGFIRINRKLFDHIFWNENREYSRAEAWIDLIQLASYTDNNKKIIDGTVIRWGRGQYPVSYSFLSKRWNWSVHKVRIFIDLLKSERQVATQPAQKATILTLCNYDFYNPKSQADVQAEEQAKGKQTAGSKEDKEREEENIKENLIKENSEEDYETWRIENDRKNREFFKLGEYAEPEEDDIPKEFL